MPLTGGTGATISEALSCTYIEALSCGPALTYSEALSYTQWLAAERASPHQRLRDPSLLLDQSKEN